MVENVSKKLVLEEVFKGYAKFGNAKSGGTHITLTNLDKWLKEAGIIDGKKISTTDTEIIFQRFKSKTIQFKQFMKFIDSICKECSLKNPEEIIDKLSKCAIPGTSNATKTDASNIVSRLTDTSKYTGTHKERFDEQSKGKGKAGREDITDKTGYVQGYKHKDTYNKPKK